MLLLHPEVGQRDCSDCSTYEFNHKSGEMVMRGNPRQPVKRPTKGPGSLPPCLSGIACAKGRRGETRELTAKNWQAYQHFKRCKATGHFPDDPIVARNAAIIREVELAIEEGRADATSGFLGNIARIARQIT